MIISNEMLFLLAFALTFCLLALLALLAYVIREVKIKREEATVILDEFTRPVSNPKDSRISPPIQSKIFNNDLKRKEVDV